MNTSPHLYTFNKVAILGSGVMGAQIAAYFANINMPVVMLDQQDNATQSLQKLGKLTPPPLATKSLVRNIVTGSFEENLSWLSDCDLIIEAIIEDLEIKQQLFTQITPYVTQDTVIASNTSGLSINSIAKTLPESLRSRFLGIHFFNPPRFMSLVELIPSTDTEEKILHKIEGFISIFMGKEVVYAKDSAGFVANRLGVFALLATIYHANRLGIAPDTVDVLTGKLIGKAKSATYRTADVVGLDVLKFVVENIAHNQKNDPWHEYIKLPTWIGDLIQQGALGSKVRKGIYQKKGKDILVFDEKIKDYRPKEKQVNKNLLTTLKKSKNVLADIITMVEKKSEETQVDFLWSVHRDTMHYCAHHLIDIAYSVADVDRALKAGFGWKKGVFESWQAVGIDKVNALIEKDIAKGKSMAQQALPKWVKTKAFYDNKENSLSPVEQKLTPIATHDVYQRHWQISDFTEVLYENDGVIMRKVEDGIAVLTFKSTMNAINYFTLQGINESLDYLEKNHYFSLILASDKSGVFCAGANLFEVLFACKLGRLHEKGGLVSKAKEQAFRLMFPNMPKVKYDGPLYEVVIGGQDTVMRLKHSPIYTIAAVDGLALGGGCELLLHCNHVVASLNSYIGLVEVGVGVLPSFGGCKEMVLRAQKAAPYSLAKATQYFEQIAMAKVSNSAQEALEMGYLMEANTTIISHPNELLFCATSQARHTMNTAFTPPQKYPLLPVGNSGKANFLSAITNFYEGAYISDHDKQIATYVAEIFSGEVDDGVKVSQDWLLQLESERFMKLLATQKTQERIEHMLKNSKPLRN